MIRKTLFLTRKTEFQIWKRRHPAPALSRRETVRFIRPGGAQSRFLEPAGGHWSGNIRKCLILKTIGSGPFPPL
jgi:hypothetical protein